VPTTTSHARHTSPLLGKVELDCRGTDLRFLRGYLAVAWLNARTGTLAIAAASAGCLASLGTPVRSLPELEHQWATLRDRSSRPFVINHTGRSFNPEAFAVMLAFKPAAISFHMGYRRI
jgi:hypothetical protein